MKKLLTVLTLITALTQADAQYKKASFFARSGRFYEVGGSYRFLNEGRSGGEGIFLSVGNAVPGKHIHHTFEFEYITPIKFNYTDVYNNGSATTTTKVTGKSRGMFVVPRYTLGYFFGNTASDGAKLLPFINLHLGYMFARSFGYETNPPNVDPNRYPSGSAAFLYGGGVGALYKLNAGIGLRGSVNYNGVFDDNGAGTDGQVYHVLPSHVGISLAVRFMLNGDN